MQQEDIPTVVLNKFPEEDYPTIRIVEEQRLLFGSPRLERAIQISSLVISLFLVGFLFSSLYPELPYLYSFRLKPAVQWYWPNLAAVLVLLVVGFNLYVFRGYKRFWFGIGEILFACGLGWYATNKAVAGSVADAIVILFASLYIMGRGWVNVSTEARNLRIEKQGKRD